MAGEILTKSTGESRRYDFDFDPKLFPSDTVSAVTSVIGVPSGLTIAAASITSPKIQSRISGGVDGTLYVITAIVTTTGLDTLELVARLRVEDG